MEIIKEEIDQGKAFDFGRVSDDYARFRDIYPEEFYQKIVDRGLCIKGQNVLDLGTGTGVLPRNMARFGANWTATDISKEQIETAKALSKDMNIQYLVSSAEDLDFPQSSFDVITACQCFFYFDTKTIAPVLHRLLKPSGKLLILYMAWLPYEDEVAKRSEEIALKYSPHWSGAGETEHPIEVDEDTLQYFNVVEREEFRLKVPFTRDSWHGRMKTCRGIGASLSKEEFDRWDKEHYQMLERCFPEQFEVLHYAALAILEKKGT
ncbi:MAG: methyltransferase domain-containing protein [Ruminococcus sp.]|nr:methyltransferase domain-containing protein [Ruminococcus sp.]